MYRTPEQIAIKDNKDDELHKRKLKYLKNRYKNKTDAQKKQLANESKISYWRCRSKDGSTPPQNYIDDIDEWHRRRQLSYDADKWRVNADIIGIKRWSKGEKYFRKYKPIGNTSICWDCKRIDCQWMDINEPMPDWSIKDSTIHPDSCQVVSCSQYDDDILS